MNKLFLLNGDKQSMLYDGNEMKSASLLWERETDAWKHWSQGPATPTQRTYQVIPVVFRAVAKIAQSVGSMPFTIYKGSKKSNKEVDASNDYQNAVGFLPNPGALFATLSQSLDLSGAAYLYPNRNPAKYTKELQFWSIGSCMPNYSTTTGELESFTRTTQSGQVQYTPDDVIWFWLPDPFVENGPPKAFPVSNALNAAGVLGNLDIFVAQYFRRGAVRPLVVSVKGMPNQAERERMETWFTRLMGGVKNAFKWNIFNADTVGITQVGDGLDQLRDTELTEQKRQDIAMALGIPMDVLFDSGDANRATADAHRLNYYEQTIVPRCQFIASILNERLLEPEGYRLEFEPDALDIFSEDENERASALNIFVSAGFELLDACDLLGIDLTKEQRAKYEAKQKEKEARAEELTAQLAKQPAPGQQPEEDQEDEDDEEEMDAAKSADLDKWRRKALNALVRNASPAVDFESIHIDAETHADIVAALQCCKTAAEVKAAFDLDIDAALVRELRRANDILERRG